MTRLLAAARLAGLALVLILVSTLAAPARSEALLADLTSHLVAITAGFTGASVTLFGATDGPGDIIVVVRGPERERIVRHKSKFVGIWVNTRDVAFTNVPSFYTIASNRPLPDIIGPGTAGLYRIGLGNLNLQAKAPAPPDANTFGEALIRAQRRDGLFSENENKVAFLGDRLFRTTIVFPSNIPTGSYLVEVLLVRDKEVVGGQTTPLVVSQVGLDAAVFDFARRHALGYGAIAVLMAVVAGWLSSLPFRHA